MYRIGNRDVMCLTGNGDVTHWERGSDLPGVQILTGNTQSSYRMNVGPDRSRMQTEEFHKNTHPDIH